MRTYSTRPQRTIVRPAEVVGVGFLTGAHVRLRFQPAPPSCGVVFVRTDLPGQPRLPAHIAGVTGTQRRTTLGSPPAQVTLVEHVLAALAGLRIDNCLVEIDGVEPPGLDGSARGFVQALAAAGAVQQAAPRTVWATLEPVTVHAEGATLTLYPPERRAGCVSNSRLWLSYFLDYGPTAPIARQIHTQDLCPGSFVRQLSACRTFLLESEAAQLRQQGLGQRITPADLLVFGPRGPIDNRLRFANEPARHKVLDMVGDLSLLGAELCGHLVGYRSGHPLNVELARVLHERLVRALPQAA